MGCAITLPVPIASIVFPGLVERIVASVRAPGMLVPLHRRGLEEDETTDSSLHPSIDFAVLWTSNACPVELQRI